jgi:ectoine hydroxylase-related dioxygenase (phytanoyl-CoA dioxygenase family)
MSTFDILLASRIREQMPEIAYGRVDAVFDDQLAQIIADFRRDYGDCERDKESDGEEAGVQRESAD